MLTKFLDALHYERLMGVEEKHFKRITKRLLDSHSLISPSASLPTPPPDASTNDDTSTNPTENNIRQWREDMLLDFSTIEASLIRLQLLQRSNFHERARYATENERIQQTASTVRSSTATLRLELASAQQTLETRKVYDALTEKITSNKALKPRAEQHASLAKLQAEIAELDRESREYARTWRERREQFGRIVEECRQLLRLIRDEKEEAERKEGMDGGAAGDEHEHEDGEGSREATPRPEEGTPRPEGGATPALEVDVATPSQSGHLTPLQKPLPSSRSRLVEGSPAASSSRLSSPGRQEQDQHLSDNADAGLEEGLQREGNGTPAVDTEMEEGEEGEEGEEREERREERGDEEHKQGKAEGGINGQAEVMDES
ncbi:MAG: hypothetical protein Q9165_006755 [Trypethelium subeluteriae]